MYNLGFTGSHVSRAIAGNPLMAWDWGKIDREISARRPVAASNMDFGSVGLPPPEIEAPPESYLEDYCASDFPSFDINSPTHYSFGVMIKSGIYSVIDSVPRMSTVLCLHPGDGQLLDYVLPYLVQRDLSIVVLNSSGVCPAVSSKYDSSGVSCRFYDFDIDGLLDGEGIDCMYSLIFSHRGVQSVLRDEAGEADLSELVSRFLEEDGYLMFDKVDFKSIGNMRNFSHLPSHCVEYLGHDQSTSSEGFDSFRVDGTHYVVPSLTDSRIYKCFGGSTVQIVQGKESFGTPMCFGGAFSASPCSLEFVRHAAIRVGSLVVVCKSVRTPESLGVRLPSKDWIASSPTSDVLNQFRFDVMATSPLEDQDIPKMTTRLVFGRDVSGAPARVIVGEGGAMALNTVTGEFARHVGKTRTGLPTVYFEGRWVKSPGDGKIQVHLVDLVFAGDGCPSEFINRVWHWVRLEQLSPWMADVFGRVDWLHGEQRPPAGPNLCVESTTPTPFFGARSAARVVLIQPAPGMFHPASGGNVYSVDWRGYDGLTTTHFVTFQLVQRDLAGELKYLGSLRDGGEVGFDISVYSLLKYANLPVDPDCKGMRDQFLVSMRGKHAYFVPPDGYSPHPFPTVGLKIKPPKPPPAAPIVGDKV